MDIYAVLQGALNQDGNIRNAAEAQLNQAQESNLAEFLRLMVEALANEQADENVRNLAGLGVKNSVWGESTEFQNQRSQAWLSIAPDFAGQIKGAVLQTLHSANAKAAHVSAQVVAAIGFSDVPEGRWPDLIGVLLANVTNEASSDVAKTASLEAMGFLCEGITPDDLGQEQTNSILTAIIDGMKSAQPNDIRRAATQSLLISLDFARANMEAAGERDMMMQMICEATQCEAEPVRVAAYECIVKIGADYYRHLASYMEVLYKLTFDSVKDDTEAVAMQAVEFWSTIADEEATLIDYEDETYAQYVLGALETLIPLLTSTLLKQDEYSDEDTWNLSTAGGACLNVVSMVAQNNVLTHVMPFVTSNIKEADWRQREAATLAFGSVIGGPDEEAITPIINEALGVLIEGTRDENVMVRDTTAWTLAKIAENHAECLTTSEGVYEAVVTSWIASLDDEPRVAHNVCFALHNLAVAAGDNDGNMLTPIFMKVMEKLVETSNRDDWQESNLRVGAYEAINQMIENCADDSLELVAQIMPLIIGRLEAAVGMQPATSDDKENRDSLITNLLGALQINIVRLDNEGPLEGKAFAGELDRIMTLALSVMQDAGAASAMEAFMVVGAICNASGSEFSRYLNDFHPILIKGLNNYEQYQVCGVAVGCVGDLMRDAGSDLPKEAVDEIVGSLLRCLEADNLDRTVKPAVLSSFGDIAMALNGNFEPYMEAVIQMLHGASQTPLDMEDDEACEYVNQLREAILEAYTCITCAMKPEPDTGYAGKLQLLMPFAEPMCLFLQSVAEDVPNEEAGHEGRDASVTRAAVGLLGDLGGALGGEIKNFLMQPYAEKLVKDLSEFEDAKDQETAAWTMEVLKGL